MNPIDIVFFVFSLAGFLMLVNGYNVFKSSFGNESEKEKADRNWKKINWIIFYLIISAIILFFLIGFLQAILESNIEPGIDSLFYLWPLFIVLSIPFIVFFLKSYIYYKREVQSVNLIDFLRIILYLKKPQSTQLRKYRAYTIFYAIGFNVIVYGSALFIFLSL